MSGQELGTQEMRVLVVDDMEVCYANLAGLREVPGYNVQLDWAQTRSEALRVLGENPGFYDWVVSDYHLGIEDPEGGLGVIEGARNISSGIGIIAMSRENMESKMLEEGADRFMFKREIFNDFEGFLEVLQGGR